MHLWTWQMSPVHDTSICRHCKCIIGHGKSDPGHCYNFPPLYDIYNLSRNDKSRKTYKKGIMDNYVASLEVAIVGEF
jgi:hypothetical protein